MKGALLMGFGTLFAGTVCAADTPKSEPARITAFEPAALISGSKATLKLRGFKLKDASELRFPKSKDVTFEIKEKKDSAAPNGLDTKIVGDAQLLVELTLPAELPPGILELVVVTPSGDATTTLALLDPAHAVDEIEPNNGFRETQKVNPSQALRGSIQGEKDVDVYELAAKAGQKFNLRVTGGSSLLMDAVLTCYDAGGQFLAASDDTENRDPALSLSAPADGSLFLCVSDAHDKGGEWHGYLLTVEEAK